MIFSRRLPSELTLWLIISRETRDTLCKSNVKNTELHAGRINDAVKRLTRSLFRYLFLFSFETALVTLTFSFHSIRHRFKWNIHCLTLSLFNEIYYSRFSNSWVKIYQWKSVGWPSQTVLNLCKYWQRGSNSPHKSGLWIVSHKGKIQYLAIHAPSPSTWWW